MQRPQDIVRRSRLVVTSADLRALRESSVLQRGSSRASSVLVRSAAALPIDDFIPEILAAVRSRRALILSAAPGAGKTTRVPPALAADGPVIVLQPRRVAARSMARRIADEQGWTLGREVGWHVRFERKFSADTRVLFATEGILTSRLQQDPLLSGFRTIVLDEFHERSIHADLGLALARQAWRARDDLRIVVMSATLQADPLAAFLDGCPQIDGARTDPPAGDRLPAVADRRGRRGRARAETTPGSVLCFLPGAPEINRALAGRPRRRRPRRRRRPAARIAAGGRAGSRDRRGPRPARHSRDEHRRDVADGSRCDRRDRLGAAQDRALRRGSRDRLARAGADSRGRGGAAGRPRRTPRSRPRPAAVGPEPIGSAPHGEAEIHRVDLSDAVLDILAWGGDPRHLRMVRRAGRRTRVEAALASARAARRDRATAASRRSAQRMKRLPLHPRLARMLIESDGQPRGGAGVRAAVGTALQRAPPRHHVQRSAVGRGR